VRSGFFGAPAVFDRRGYLIAATVVAAKLAKADGPVCRLEIDAFKKQFSLDSVECAALGQLFDQARESPEGFQPFVVQLMEMFVHEPGASEALVDKLFRIAIADGGLSNGEIDLLGTVARMLKVECHWEKLCAQVLDDNDPYVVLGVPRDATEQEIRAAWRRLSRRYHPDAAASRGEESVDHDRMAAINAAYQRIMHGVRARDARQA
jgi:DnaJ like chaperone protein